MDNPRKWLPHSVIFVHESGLYGAEMITGFAYDGKNMTYKKASGANPPKTDFGAENPVSGKDWNNYFKDKYGAGNVQWKPSSFEDIITNPQRLYGCTPNEIKSILGDGWSFKSYGSNGLSWEFYSSEGRIFYHAGGGIHGGSYYGYATGPTGKVKIVDDTYIRTPDDKAAIIPRDK